MHIGFPFLIKKKFKDYLNFANTIHCKQHSGSTTALKTGFVFFLCLIPVLSLFLQLMGPKSTTFGIISFQSASAVSTRRRYSAVDAQLCSSCFKVKEVPNGIRDLTLPLQACKHLILPPDLKPTRHSCGDPTLQQDCSHQHRGERCSFLKRHQLFGEKQKSNYEEN